jgi:hypothetical protein
MSKFMRWLFISSAGAIFFAFPLKTESFIIKFFTKGLVIQTWRRDPPRIAFNELLASEKSFGSEDLRSFPTIDLNKKMLEKVAMQPLQWAKSRKISLKPMVFSRDVALAEIQKNAWVDDLSTIQKERILESQAKDQILDKDWSTPSWREILSDQISRAKEEIAKEQGIDSKIFVASSTEGGHLKTIETIRTADVQVAAPPADSRPIISGKVTFKNGLYMGDGYIDVRVVENGTPKGAGKIDPAKGVYSIQTEDYSGTLVASLYTKGGEKRGEGTLRLSQVSPNRFGDTELVMTPVENHVAMHYVDFGNDLSGPGTKNHYGDRGLSAHSYFTSFDTEQVADSSGQVQLANVIKGSWTVVRSDLDKYQSSIHLVQAGDQSKTPLFRKAFVSALLNIAKDLRNVSLTPETNSIVWGQAKMNSKPVSGVTVDVEYQEGYQVLYFNNLMLPDSGLKATGENGYFAILHLPEGMHALIASRGQQYFSHANVLTEPDVLTQTELIGTSHLEPVEIKVYDAFEGNPQLANVEIQSLSESVTVQGASQVYLPQIERLSLMKADPSDPMFLPTSMVYKDTQDSLFIPLVRAEWLQVLKAVRRIDDNPNATAIVGFVRDEPFDVYLPHVQDYSRNNIVYFNSQGQITEQGEAGGGFVLFNVIPGTQSVVAVSRSSNMIHDQIIPVDLGAIGTLQFHF